ncbi:MAG TPA: hypothetical protein VFV38_45820 [Ktedonobacteraceae bacterium]|nr:hypothetical protein [Ktedonobacteraceae bacterium]
MGFEWQFTPDPEHLDAAQQYSWPFIPSLPNRVKPGCFKASSHTYLFTFVSGVNLNNPDMIDAQTIILIARGLRALYNRIGKLSDDALIDYPEADLLPVRFAVLRDLVAIFEFAAEHQCCVVGL